MHERVGHTGNIGNAEFAENTESDAQRLPALHSERTVERA